MSSAPPSTASNRRSTRIEEKKRKLENPTSDNSSEINDNNSTTKQKKSKTNKNGNGNGQVDHDGKLDDDTIPPYNKTVRNELQEMPHNTIYWLCFTNQLSYYILNNAGSYGQEEELQHIPNLVNTLVNYYSQQADCFALLINDINTIHEYDDDKYYSIKGFDESMPASYYVTHADLAKSLDKATVHDDEQSTTSTSNASTKIGKDDEQNGEVDSINGGISMEVELSTNNDIPPKTTFKSLDNCEEKNVRPSPTSAIDDLSPFTNESEKSNNKSITILHQSTTSLSKLDSGKSSLLQSSPASAFRTVPQQHTLPPLKSPLLQPPPVSTFREQSTRPTLNDNDVPNSHTTEDARDKSNLKSDHIDTQLVDESPTAALQLETTRSPLVIPDSWGQSHELGPILSSIFTTLQQEHKSSSFHIIWNGMKEKYRKLTYAKSAKPNDPFLIQQKELDDAMSKFVYLVDKTHTQMRKEGKGPLSYAEEELWGLLSILGILHLKEIHPIITKDCNGGMFRLRKLTDLVGELRGQYRLLKDLDDIVNGRWKIGISNRKVEGMFRRIWEQLYPSSTDGSVEHEVDEEEEEDEEGTTVTQKKDKIDKSKMVNVAGFFYNLAESMEMNAKSPLLKEIIELAALITPSLQGHNDNKDTAIEEGTNYFMEASQSSMFSCIPGPVLEKLFNLGSVTVRGICQSPPQDISHRNEEFTNEFKSCVKFILLLTWPTEKDALYAYIEQRLDPEKDKDTLLALKAMIRPRHSSKFLKLYETQTLFDNSTLLQEYVDAYGSEGFEAVKQAAEIIFTAIRSNDKDTIYTAIASLDKKSPLGARYLHPTDKAAYSAAVEKQLKEAKEAACDNEIIVIEKTSIEQLDKKAKAEHLPSHSEKFTLLNNDGSVAGTIYKYKHNNKTIKILVTPSWHCIRGSQYTVQTRINNGQSYITIMRSLKNAKISSPASLLKQVQIFYAQLIEMEGFGDLAKDTKKCKGSIWKAIRNALPKGLCFDPIRGGVVALGKTISPINGIDSLKVVCLVAVLGIADFTTMMKIGYDIEFCCTDFSTSLLALGRSFNDPSVRLEVAAALKDDAINQYCGVISGFPKGWLAYSKQFYYAIQAPDGKCFSGKEEAKQYAYPQEAARKAAQKAAPRRHYQKSSPIIPSFWCGFGKQQLKTQLRYRNLPVSGNVGKLIERLIDDDKQLPLQSRSILLRTYKTVKKKEEEKAPKKTKKKKRRKVSHKFSVKQLVVVIGAPNPVPMTITSVKPPKGLVQGKVTLEELNNIEFKFNEIEPYTK